jgi:hypothetical protein
VYSYLDILLTGGEGKAHQRDAVDSNDLKDKKTVKGGAIIWCYFIPITIIRLIDDSGKCR